MPLQQKQTNRH